MGPALATPATATVAKETKALAIMDFNVIFILAYPLSELVTRRRLPIGRSTTLLI
jgi:hypothetical protein